MVIMRPFLFGPAYGKVRFGMKQAIGGPQQYVTLVKTYVRCET
jgi:hypothetical protein